ncbi:MAG: hypothetical protein JST92_12530 [Deltaproteobacteria bacterium]|nr:hypothetical protein [Deltaproteobacteria bacterium]
MLGPATALPAEDQAALVVEERLRTIAARFEPALRERVNKLLMAAAEAILKLCDLDLVRHESGAEGGDSHSLAVWEELAPVMMDTVQSVNTLVEIAKEAFPSAPAKDALDTLDDAFGPDASEDIADAPLQTPEQEIASLVDAVSSGLKRDVQRLGERLRNPTVMADPWNLVSDLLEFRGRLRQGIGELIYQVATKVDEAERSDVVPGYTADLEAAVLVRTASTNLAFLFRGHARRIAGSDGERIAAALADALKDLGSFARTRALDALRTADKRIFLETRQALMRFLKEDPQAAREIKLATENMARFLDSLSVISRRENLRLHDRSRLAGTGRLLEAAQEAIGAGDLARARKHLTEAAQFSWLFYGRDQQLDAYLRSLRHFPVEWLADAEVEGEVERLGAILANIAPP